MNTSFNIFEIINVLIVILLFFTLIKKICVETLFIILFVYGTLHFSFATIALATNESASLLITLHNKGGGFLAKATTLILLSVVFIYLSDIAYRSVQSRYKGLNRKIVIYVLMIMVAILLGYIFNVKDGDLLQLKNVLSIEVLFVFFLVGHLAANDSYSLNPSQYYSWWLGGLFVLSVANCIAIYEVFNHQSWASTIQSSGDIVYRASSILFNPNLFGYWASLIYLICSYGLYVYKTHQKVMLFGMILASIAIYFSGSRSAGYLLLMVLFIPVLLMRVRSHCLPLIVLPMTILILYLSAIALGNYFFNNEGWNHIALLGLRFYEALPNLFAYLLKKFDFIAYIPSGIGITGVSLGAEVTESIEGRFVGEGRDSGWMVLYQDVGWIGVGAIIFSTSMLIVWGLRAYSARPNVAGAYALSALVYCLLTGLVMRFQIFPVWLFTSLVLVHCTIYWRQIDLPPFFNRK
jgi:hypothetical protein